MPHADRADGSIRRGIFSSVIARTEHFAFGFKLDVDFQTDDGFYGHKLKLRDDGINSVGEYLIF
jgi:hypothetical protein